MEHKLFPDERQKHIVKVLAERPRVTVSELSQQFAVSEVTIRKDLARLAELGLVTRLYGGAILPKPNQGELAFETRLRLQTAEKERIGAAAARLIQDGDSIVLDASTSALKLVPFLRDHKELTVFTNGIQVILALASCPGVNVFVLGGMLHRASYASVGTWGEAVLRQFHIQKAFVGARGFTIDEGLTDVNNEEVKFKRAITEVSKVVIAMIDHTKWGQVSLATYCPSSQVNMIITDIQAPEDAVAQARASGIDVRLV